MSARNFVVSPRDCELGPDNLCRELSEPLLKHDGFRKREVRVQVVKRVKTS